MRLRQGTFSYLPDFTDEQVAAQINYVIDNKWSISIEYTDDPHPRNTYWEMWGPPMFDQTEPSKVLDEIHKCRAEHPREYIKVNAYDRTLGRQTTALSFIVNRPKHEPGFALERTEGKDRQISYTIRSYAANEPPGERYTNHA